MKKLLSLLFILFLSILVYVGAQTEEQKLSHQDVQESLQSRENLFKLQPDDHYIGVKDAPVIIIEYSSFACPHCAEFHKRIFSQIKENYIDKGKVLYIHRHFPTNKPSLVAAALTTCSGKYFQFLAALFESQNVWAFNKNYEQSLLNIAKLSGMSNDEFTKCIQNKEMLDQIYERTFIATRVLDVKATPAVLINGQVIRSLVSYKSVSEQIEDELAKIRK